MAQARHRRGEHPASRYSLSGGHIPADAGGLRPPVTLRPEPQAAASPKAKTIVPKGIKITHCPSPAYTPAPADAKVWVRPEAGRIRAREGAT